MAKITPVFMSESTYSELSEHLKKSYKNACILYIDHISNPKLEAAFEARRKTIISRFKYDSYKIYYRQWL